MPGLKASIESGLEPQVDGKKGKGSLLLELRMLRLADHQAATRAVIDKEQEEIQGMSERNYRKFARNCLRQRVEFIKQVCLCIWPWVQAHLCVVYSQPGSRLPGSNSRPDLQQLAPASFLTSPT